MFMSGDDINSKCAKCHDTRKTIQSHSKWLPQADLHIDSLLCITCHTGSKDYVIIMSIESRQPGSKETFKTAPYEELAKRAKGDDISTVIDVNGDKLVLLKELREFNRQLRGQNLRLWGMMVPETVTHSYQIRTTAGTVPSVTCPAQKPCRRVLSFDKMGLHRLLLKRGYS
jgi:hypothetical protein